MSQWFEIVLYYKENTEISLREIRKSITVKEEKKGEWCLDSIDEINNQTFSRHMCIFMDDGHSLDFILFTEIINKVNFVKVTMSIDEVYFVGNTPQIELILSFIKEFIRHNPPIYGLGGIDSSINNNVLPFKYDHLNEKVNIKGITSVNIINTNYTKFDSEKYCHEPYLFQMITDEIILFIPWKEIYHSGVVID